MTEDMQHRKLIEVPFGEPIDESVDVSRVAIRLPRDLRASVLDVGALMYSRRDRSGLLKMGNRIQHAWTGHVVDPESLVPHREEFLRRMLDDAATAGNRPKTFDSDCRQLFYLFEWCDENGFENFLATKKDLRDAFFAYTNIAFENVSLEISSPRTNRARQAYFEYIAQVMWGQESIEVTRGIQKLRAHSKNADRDLPEVRLVREYVRVVDDLRKGLTSCILEKKPFPWAFSVNSIDSVFFPGTAGIYTQYNDPGFLPHYPEERRLRTADEMIEEAANRGGELGKHRAQTSEYNSSRKLKDNNGSERSEMRRLYASIAMDAHVWLIRALTGSNLSTMVDWEISGTYSMERDSVSRNLRGVKIKARGKKVAYAFGTIGYKILVSYLELREWVLNGEVYDRLIFSYSAYDNPVVPISASSHVSDSMRRIHRRVGKTFFDSSVDLPNVSVEMRNFKSQILHTLKVDPETVSGSLNHTQETNDKSYSRVSPDAMNEQFSVYWRSVEEARKHVRKREGVLASTASPTGSCATYLSPSASIENPPIEPDCKRPEGCLFCEHYLCHSDEEDVHKILSAQFVIQELRAWLDSVAHAEELFAMMVERVDVIVEEVAALSEEHADIVSKVRNRVYGLGDLTLFWEKKLNRYERLGVLV
jgi:hypothetical protein